MELAGLDPVTAKLIVELQLADINATLVGLDNDPSEGDELEAFQAMRDNYQDVLQVLEGQVLVLDILKNDHSSRVAFERLVQEEKQASRDHDMARQLAGLGSAPEAPDLDQSTKTSLTINSPKLRPVSASISGNTINAFGDSILFFENNASSSKGKGKMKTQEEHATHTFCCSCFERHPRFDVLELSCKRRDEDLLHAYCRDCVKGLFGACLRDTTLWPPRCCGVRISVYAAAHLLDPKLVTQCETKDEELSTPNPTYCSNRSCAEWIPPSNIKAEVGKCYACSKDTCATCKNPKHKGLCPKDEDVQQFMEYAGKQKYKRCFNCRTVVELEMGCNHIYCRCGAEFCYLCGDRWKTCACDTFVEGRLFRGHVTQTPGSPIVMPEEDELPEPNPIEDVISGLQQRLASFTEGSFDTASTDAAKCSHNWVRSTSSFDGKEGCNICYEAVLVINNCFQCGVSVCNMCLNNRL